MSAELGADIYLFSTYKTYGPHQGVMAIKRALGEKLPNQGHYFNAGTLYQRFTPAGPDHAQVAACSGVADYIDALYARHHDGETSAAARSEAVRNLMRAHETELLQPVLDFLATKNSARLLGPRTAETRMPTIAIALNETGEAAEAKLAERGIMAGGGHFYGARCIKAQGIDEAHGVLRVSFVHYTSKEEVDKLMTALDDML